MKRLSIDVVDSGYRPLDNADVRVLTIPDDRPVPRVDGMFRVDDPSIDRVVVRASAPGYEPETHAVRLRDAVTQVVLGLRRAGELGYKCGDSRLAFAPDEKSFLLLVLGPRARKAFADAKSARKLASRSVFPPSSKMADPDKVYERVDGDMSLASQLVDDLRAGHLEVRILRVIQHGERTPIGLSNDIVVRFDDRVTRAEADAVAAHSNLRIAREVRHAGNSYLLTRDDLPSYAIVDTADSLDRMDDVVYAELNLTFTVESDQYVPNDPLWASVPYLQLIGADVAWGHLGTVSANLRGGSPSITIAVVDDMGVSANHPEFTSNLTDGTQKLVASTDYTVDPPVAQGGTFGTAVPEHGTQCAGTATAAFDDARGLPGVAPNCHLIGARVNNPLDALAMADVYLHVAGFLNGQVNWPAPPSPAADVISASFGTYALPLQDTVRDCFDFLTTYGRGGKGCVLCFSLGNPGYVDFTAPALPKYRAWPTYARTLGVGSSIGANPTNPVPNSVHANPGGQKINVPVAADTRSLYSPYGSAALRKPDLVATSSTAFDPGGNPVDPIMSAVLVGTGNVNGCTVGVCNDYRKSFGGTSQSAPSVAGAVALMLSALPSLNWVQVRDILRASCVRIDATPTGDARHDWQDLDGDGNIDFSQWYGAGRLDAGAAVGMALDGTTPFADVYVRDDMTDDGDVPSTGGWAESPDIWVRRDASEPIPALPWANPPPHENPLRGQDNAIFCRVRNRGTATATAVYVRAMVAHWPGLEFAYPADFQPTPHVGSVPPIPLARGTYLIGEQIVENLASGADAIVKIVWPKALIPPESVMVGSSEVLWHPCLLLDASPHDGPAPVPGLAVPVQGDNNIAQRNVSIVDFAVMQKKILWSGAMAGSDEGIESVIIDAQRLLSERTVLVRIEDVELMRQLLTAQPRSTQPASRELARATSGDMESPDEEHGQCSLRRVIHDDQDALEISGLRGQVEIPLRLAAGQFAMLLVGLPGTFEGKLRFTQRRRDKVVSPGYMFGK